MYENVQKVFFNPDSIHVQGLDESIEMLALIQHTLKSFFKSNRLKIINSQDASL